MSFATLGDAAESTADAGAANDDSAESDRTAPLPVIAAAPGGPDAARPGRQTPGRLPALLLATAQGEVA